LLGLSGLLGGLILLAGDQLLYWGPVENLSTVTTIATGQIPIETLGSSADWRLILTGLAPILTGWGYALVTKAGSRHSSPQARLEACGGHARSPQRHHWMKGI
jgi:hypothetical protein